MPQINLGTYSVSARIILDSIKQIQEENPDISLDDIQLSSKKERLHDQFGYYNGKTRSYYFEYPDKEEIKLKKRHEEKIRFKQNFESKLKCLNLDVKSYQQMIGFSTDSIGLSNHYNNLAHEIYKMQNIKYSPKDPIKFKEILATKIAKLERLNQVKEIINSLGII